MPQFNKAVYDKILANINQDQQAKRLGDYFLIQKSRQLGKAPGLLSRIGVLTHGVSSFGEGVVSFPISWWAAHIHLAALSGLFGTQQKQKANIRQVIFDTLMQAAFNYPLRTGKVALAFFIDKTDKDPVGTLTRLGGRYVGGKLTNAVVLRGLKSGKLKRGLSYGSSAYSIYGAMVLSIAKGVRSLENMLWAGISGQYNLPRKEILKKISSLVATDDELAEAFNMVNPILKEIDLLSHKKSMS